MSEAQKTPVHGRAGEPLGQIQSHLNEQEKKERLQDELAEFLFQVTEENFDSDRLDALLDALEEVTRIPELPDTQESFRAFEEKYASVFASVESASAERSSASLEKKHSRHTIFKILPIAAILVLILGSITAQSFGFNLFGNLARWTSEIFHLEDSATPYATITKTPLAEGESASYDSLQEAVDAFGINAPLVPTWIPERFELVSVTAVNQPTGVLIVAECENDIEFLQIRYKELKGNTSQLEKEDSSVELYIWSGIYHYLVTDLGREKVSWQNGIFECCIAGNVSEIEMTKMINSIYEGK